MGIMQFLCALFELNEKLPPRNRMTDAEIARQILENYPLTKVAESIRLYNEGANRNQGGRPVGYWRGHYNSGNICPNRLPPAIQSRRYNDFGQPYTARGTRARLSKGRRSSPTLSLAQLAKSIGLLEPEPPEDSSS